MIGLALISSACNRNGELADAYGSFEVDEVLISAQLPGELVQYSIEEGAFLEKGKVVAMIDTTTLFLTKQELLANRNAISAQYANIKSQIDVLNDELANLEREHQRVKNLITAGAATTKQLDDIEGNINVVKSKIQSVRTQNATILAQIDAIDAKKEQLDEQIRKSIIINPIDGIVLAKLAEQNEYTAPGKPLYKIADPNTVFIRVFISEDQLSLIELGKAYTVKIDGPDGSMISYDGIVSWISSEAEFTPKTVQTKKDRVDLVYAVKLRVINDGKIKIGMPGELWISENN
jgi:HlyD family secretion protein